MKLRLDFFFRYKFAKNKESRFPSKLTIHTHTSHPPFPLGFSSHPSIRRMDNGFEALALFSPDTSCALNCKRDSFLAL